MKMDTPSETSISWGGIFSSALARNVSLGNKISTIDITEGRDIQKPMLGVNVESCYYHESTWPSLRIPPYTNSLFIRLIPMINKYKAQTLGLLSR